MKDLALGWKTIEDRRNFIKGAAITALASTTALNVSPLFSQPQTNVMSAQEKTLTTENLSFEVYDVFSANKFLGNQLAVFKDARGLSDEQLQQIANEMNYSETTFVYPDDNGLYTNPVRTRIFNTYEEMPFAGHPTLGTAMAISQWRNNIDKVVLQLDVGPIPIDFKTDENGIVGTMSQVDPTFSNVHTAAEIAVIIGLDVSDIDMDIPPQSVNTGISRALVMLKSLEAVRRMTVDWEMLDRWNEGQDMKVRSIYALTREVEAGADFHARQPRRNLVDDPVTGSSGGPAIAWLVRQELVSSRETITIEQGFEVNRGGEMYVSARLENDKVTNVLVGGRAVRSIEGILEI